MLEWGACIAPVTIRSGRRRARACGPPAICDPRARPLGVAVGDGRGVRRATGRPVPLRSGTLDHVARVPTGGPSVGRQRIVVSAPFSATPGRDSSAAASLPGGGSRGRALGESPVTGPGPSAQKSLAEPQLYVIPICPWRRRTWSSGRGGSPARGTRAAVTLSHLASSKPEYFADATLVAAQSVAPVVLSPTTDCWSLSSRVTTGSSAPSSSSEADSPCGSMGRRVRSTKSTTRNPSQFSDETVLDYIRFFFYFVRGDGGFVLIESPAELDAPADAADRRSGRTITDMLTLDEARGSVKALELRSSEEPGDGGSRMRPSRIRVRSSSARCRSVLTGRSRWWTTSRLGCSAISRRRSWRPSNLQESTGDREVTEAVVAVLLEDALREMNSGQPGHLLLSHFNSETQVAKPIEQLTRIMSESEPIVIIESDIPFVEDFVAGLAAPGDAG